MSVLIIRYIIWRTAETLRFATFILFYALWKGNCWNLENEPMWTVYESEFSELLTVVWFSISSFCKSLCCRFQYFGDDDAPMLNESVRRQKGDLTITLLVRSVKDLPFERSLCFLRSLIINFILHPVESVPLSQSHVPFIWFRTFTLNVEQISLWLSMWTRSSL